MGLFDLVKQNHRIGIAPYLLGKLASIVVSHISGRRSDQLGDAVLLHIFRHIYPDHSFLTPEQHLCQSFGKLCLSHAGGSQEQERTDGTARVLQAYASPADSPGHCGDCFILADDTLVQNLLQLLKALRLRLRKFADGNLRPVSHDLRYFIFADCKSFFPASASGLCPLLLQFFLQPHTLFSKFCRMLKILLPDSLFYVPQKICDTPLQFCRGMHQLSPAQTYTGAGLIHQVNCLIRKEAVADVTFRQLHRRLQSFIRDFHLMMTLIISPESFQNLHRLLLAGLLHHNRLETALQSRVFLDMFSVFLHSSGANHLKLSSGQSRL